MPGKAMILLIKIAMTTIRNRLKGDQRMDLEDGLQVEVAGPIVDSGLARAVMRYATKQIAHVCQGERRQHAGHA